MRILIIEDEEPAAERLKRMVKELEPEADVIDTIVSVKSAIKWFEENKKPDLILADIHLADGSSFEIFNETEIEVPVIFITAYDQYAIQAFKLNSVDYLLKPLKRDDLKAALEKFNKFKKENKVEIPDFRKLLESMGKKVGFKKRFLIRYGEHIRTIETDQIAYFYTEEKNNFLKTKDNHTYPLDYNLDKLEEMLDPEKFFRINRQFIINIEAIEQMFAFSKSRVKVILKPSINIETIVSTERSPHFKEWLSGSE